jgi:hypothetical protein
MNNYDWKIHKKLIDAGGLGPVVYILPARGSGKPLTERERVYELLASGRKVVYVRPKESKQTCGGRQSWLLPDKDILTPERYERAEKLLNEFLKGGPQWIQSRKSVIFAEKLI